MKFLRGFLKFLPTFLSALVLAIIVWVSAVTASDPNEEIVFPSQIPLKVIGQDPNLIMTNDIPDSISVTILAPKSIQIRLSNEPGLIHATLNLASLDAGVSEVTPQITVDVRPAEVTKITPEVIKIEMETLASKEIAITLSEVGSLPISYVSDEPILSSENVIVTGAASSVNSVAQVQATIDLTNSTSSISKKITLKAYNTNGNIVDNLTLNPNSIDVQIPIRQLGGYRNAFVKIISTGQIASGFYLTNIFADPPNVTIYSSDPVLANNMPAYVETNPINLNGADEDFSVDIPLNLPDGISLIGETIIRVQVGVAAIESSKNFLNVEIQVTNLDPQLKAELNSNSVDIYLSGPLYLLEVLDLADITVTLDLEGRGVGTYQLVPQVSLVDTKINVDAILPGTIEVIISQ